MSCSTFYVVRHLQRVDSEDSSMKMSRQWNKTDYRQYQNNPYLSDKIDESKNKILSSLPNIERITSSPFLRCIQTALIIAKSRGIMKIDVDFGISENISNDIFYGISGMNISEIWEQSIAYLDESDRQMLNLSYEGEYKTISIETDEQYNQRIISSMKRIINKNSMNNLIITHSYALRCFDMQDMRYGDVMKVCSNFEVNVQKIVKDPQQIGGNNSIDRYNINRMLFLWLESNF